MSVALPALVPGQDRVQRIRAFDLEEASLCLDTTHCRESSRLSSRGEHTMTRHDDGKRVTSERLSDRTRQAVVTETSRNIAVRPRLAGRNRARLDIHALLEVGHTAHVESDGGEILFLPLQ